MDRKPLSSSAPITRQPSDYVLPQDEGLRIYLLAPAALAADMGLRVVYGVYGYFFHLGFDRLRRGARLTTSLFRNVSIGVGFSAPIGTRNR